MAWIEVEVDVENHLDEVSTEALKHELARRDKSLGETREWDLLASHIALGETNEALSLLERLAPAANITSARIAQKFRNLHA